MLKSVVITCSIFSLFFLSSVSAETGEQKHLGLTEKVLEATGFDAQFSALPEMMTAIGNNLLALDDSMSDDEKSKLKSILINDMAPEKLRPSVLKQVYKELTDDELKSILRLSDADNVKAFNEAELQVATAEGMKEIAAYANNLNEHPPTKRRLQLIERLDRAAELSESNARLGSLINANIIEQINHVSQKFSEVDIKSFINENNVMLKRQARKTNQLILIYTYRNFSNDDFEKYVTLYEQNLSLKHFQTSINHALEETFAFAARNVGRDISEVVEKNKRV